MRLTTSARRLAPVLAIVALNPSDQSVPEGQQFTVDVTVAEVTNVGSYEWKLGFDSAIIQYVSVVNGPFLGSTGRSVLCPDPILDVGTVRFGCGTTGNMALPGPSGSGLLSTVSFTAIASRSSSLCLSWAALADPDANDIPTGVVNGSIAVGGGSPPAPSCAPAATPTPATPPPDYTPPAGATETPVPPGPTATPVPPAGPTPTPAPTPPPESAEVVDLIAGCNPLATTYPDGTTVQTLAAAISPPDILEAMWAFEGSLWLGYSPQYPQASDLAVRGFLDVVFLCVDAAGTFVRPLV